MLTIFDCDGVLIDSEIIVSEIAANLLAGVGYEATALEITARFTGYTDAEMFAIVEEDIGRTLPADFLDRFERAVADGLRRVKPVAGMAALVDRLEGARCVCSNSGSARVRATLETAGLYDRFKPYLYSAPEVGSRRGKPAPDVFLYAAGDFRTAPADTVVIEDSPAGVAGAAAAGMRVIGFTGGAHAWPGLADALTEAGAETVVRRAIDIAAVIDAFRSWKGIA